MTMHRTVRASDVLDEPQRQIDRLTDRLEAVLAIVDNLAVRLERAAARADEDAVAHLRPEPELPEDAYCRGERHGRATALRIATRWARDAAERARGTR